MIWRVRTKGTILDFGSTQAALQFLDNYPPHIRDQVVYKEISSAEITSKVVDIKSEISRQRRDNTGEVVATMHLEWLLSRLEFYENALPFVIQQEQAVAEKEQSRIGKYSSNIDEVWKDSGEFQRRSADSL